MAKEKPIIRRIREKKWKWIGHSLRKDPQAIERYVLDRGYYKYRQRNTLYIYILSFTGRRSFIATCFGSVEPSSGNIHRILRKLLYPQRIRCFRSNYLTSKIKIMGVCILLREFKVKDFRPHYAITVDFTIY
jgi:hypothetical protein